METMINSAFSKNHILTDEMNSFKNDPIRQDSLDDIFENDEALINDKLSDYNKSTENIPILNPANHSIHEDMTGKQSVEICPEMVHPNLKVGQDDFSLLKIIGKGGYGTVFLVRKINEPEMNNLFAMKVLKKARIICNEKDTVHTISERNILKMLKHPFLVKLHYAFQNQENLYIVLEYCPGGELFSYLERQCILSETHACFYSSEIILAIGHLHSLGIIYRDLKLENILLDKDGHVKLTDFGLSKEGVNLTNTFCGTIEYMAPEIIQCQGHGKEVDWWSLGTLLYDMLSGGPPFSPDASKKETATNILTGELKFPESFSPEVIDFLKGLLTRDPKKRLGSKNDVEDIKMHCFFVKHKINWQDVYDKNLVPPFKPVLQSPTDVSLFDEHFTTLKPTVTPSDNPSMIPPDCFSGFSYVGNSIRERFIDANNFVGSVRTKRRMNRLPSHQSSEMANEANGIEFKSYPNKQFTSMPFHGSIKESPKMESKMRTTDNDKNISQSTIEEAEEVVDTMDLMDGVNQNDFFTTDLNDYKDEMSNQIQKQRCSSFNDLSSANHNNGTQKPYSPCSEKNQNNCLIS